jgi:hypothetical protein
MICPIARIGLGVLTAVVWSFAICLTGAQARHAASWLVGVHVCTAGHYDQHSVSCSADDPRLDLEAFGGAWFSASGLGGGNFTSNTLTLIVHRHTSTGDYELGRTELKTGLEYAFIAGQLAPTFQEMGIWPSIGTTYVVEVDGTDGAKQVLLGTAAFTIVAPVAATPVLSLSCAAIDLAGNDPTNVRCTLTGRGFRPLEAINITYTTLVQNSRGVPVTTSVRRAGETDAQGGFHRPPFSFDQGAQHPGYLVTAAVSGAAGEWVTAKAAQGGLAPDVSKPRLSFSCLAIDPVGNDPTNVDCILSGHGFLPNDTIQITYTVTMTDNQGMSMTTVYHRSGTADAAGAFRRPTFSFDQGARHPGYTVQVVVRGAAGGQVTASAKGS